MNTSKIATNLIKSSYLLGVDVLVPIGQLKRNHETQHTKRERDGFLCDTSTAFGLLTRGFHLVSVLCCYRVSCFDSFRIIRVFCNFFAGPSCEIISFVLFLTHKFAESYANAWREIADNGPLSSSILANLPKVSIHAIRSSNPLGVCALLLINVAGSL